MLIVQYVITVKKVRSNMNKLEINFNKLGKLTIIMLICALITSIILLFINPWYSIILVISGLIGLFLGMQIIIAFIPDDHAEFLKNIADMAQKSRDDTFAEELNKAINDLNNINN